VIADYDSDGTADADMFNTSADGRFERYATYRKRTRIRRWRAKWVRD
jgi:hypothetical protein